MADYGVLPTGFVRKPLTVVKSEIEAAMITEFGAGVILTPQSPFGQLIGLFATAIAAEWELAEDIYQSYDPDQAEGNRLDILGRVRQTFRGIDENDRIYRQAITNAGTARINLADLSRAVANVPGVRYRNVFVNETRDTDRNNIPPNTVAVSVLGGDNDDLANAINAYVIPGISTFGDIEVNFLEDGFCRALFITRPIEVPTRLQIYVRASPTRGGCPAPSPTAIEAATLEHLRGLLTRTVNGQQITPYVIRSFIESNFPTVEFVSMEGFRDNEETSSPDGTINYSFKEIADVQEVEVYLI